MDFVFLAVTLVPSWLVIVGVIIVIILGFWGFVQWLLK
jgi:hypothetical protein